MASRGDVGLGDVARVLAAAVVPVPALAREVVVALLLKLLAGLPWTAREGKRKIYSKLNVPHRTSGGVIKGDSQIKSGVVVGAVVV